MKQGSKVFDTMCPIKSTKSFWSANIRIRLSFFNSSLPVVVMAADSWGEVLLNESFPLIVLCHGRGHLISSTGTWGKLPGNGNMGHTSTNFHKNYQAFIIRKFFEKKISLWRKQNSMPRLKSFITNISLFVGLNVSALTMLLDTFSRSLASSFFWGFNV